MPQHEIRTIQVVGGGLAGTAIAAGLARSGASVRLLYTATPRASEPIRWLPAPRVRARTLPPSVLVEESLPVDILLAGEHRVETTARIGLVDHTRLRAAWRSRARAAGVRFVECAPASGPVRAMGRTCGVRLTDGTTHRASLTIDATGTGVLLGALPGPWLPGGRVPSADREPVLFARLSPPPDRVQASWVGRAQLVLGLQGGLAWRCTPRAGGPVLVAVTAGPGAVRSRTEELLAPLVGSAAASAAATELRWLPCRRPLDGLAADGLLACGAAAGLLDTLLGCQIDALEKATDALIRSVPALTGERPPSTASLFDASRTVQRCVGGILAGRQLERRWLQTLSPAGRESMVLSGVLGPDAWAAAIDGRPLVPRNVRIRARRGQLPPSHHPALRKLRSDLDALRALHAHHPDAYDMFAIDDWQVRMESVFAPGGRGG